MTLTLLETITEARQLERLIDKKEVEILELTIIALSIPVQALLKKQGIPFLSTLRFFDNSSHQRCLLHSHNITNLVEQSAKCEINGYEYFGIIDWLANGVRHSPINLVIFYIEILLNAIESLQATEIIVFTTKSQYLGWLINDREFYHNEVCQVIAQTLNIDVIEFNVENVKEELVEVNNNKSPKIFKTIQKLLNIWTFNSASPTIVITTKSYNLLEVSKIIKSVLPKARIVLIHERKINFAKRIIEKFKNGIEIISLEDITLETTIDDAHKILEIERTLNVLKAACNFRNIPYWEIVENKICTGVIPDTKRLVIKTLRLEKLLSILNPVLCLSVSSRGWTYVLGEICRNRKIEAMCISHGTVVPPKNEMEKIVNKKIARAVILNKYPSIALQTPLAEQFFDHFNTISEKVITGPLILIENNEKQNHQTGLKILHAVTLKSKKNLKFWGVQNHDELLSSLIDLIEVFRDCNNVEFVIKLHPHYPHLMSTEDLITMLPDSSNTIISTKPLREELKDTNLVVSYSSTVIEEALINHIPVLLYDKWDRYMHIKSHDLEVKEYQCHPIYYIKSKVTLRKYASDLMNTKPRLKFQDWKPFTYPNDVKKNFEQYIERCLVALD